MKNNIENFVKQNRRDFDVFEPSDAVWDKIEAALDGQQPKKSLRLYMWSSIAASIVIISGIFWLLAVKPQKGGPVDIADVNPAIAQREVRFAGMIEEKRDSLQVLTENQPELSKKFSLDLEKLDADYEKLKKELPQSPNPTLVVKAMVKNREIQLGILNQQLLIANQVNGNKKEDQL
ncbi:hypothetical protein [Pedobacter sp. SYP-B3415]|uniref:hypothetical protein n=1 Tax=Pedobacter sp. SYP-B3415 TaxID=2496641 RepID=UPI001F11590A|nr:hypothetical protein [Pedobacter sp. SYP-B3415]